MPISSMLAGMMAEPRHLSVNFHEWLCYNVYGA